MKKTIIVLLLGMPFYGNSQDTIYSIPSCRCEFLPCMIINKSFKQKLKHRISPKLVGIKVFTNDSNYLNPLPGATLEVEQTTGRSIDYTESSGEATIKIVAYRPKIKVSHAGYQTFTKVLNDSDRSLTIILAKDFKLLEPVVVDSYTRIILCRMPTGRVGGIQIHKKDSVHSKASIRPTVTIYPNPVKINEAITVLFNAEKDGNYAYSLMTIDGRKISTEHYDLSKGLNKIIVKADPRIARGIYLLLWSDSQDQRILTKKLIIQ